MKQLGILQVFENKHFPFDHFPRLDIKTWGRKITHTVIQTDGPCEQPKNLTSRQLDFQQ